jgi:hypothetical protein
MNRWLILDENTRAIAKKVLDYAEANPFTMEEMIKVIHGQAPTAGEREGHICQIPKGFRVVFSYEEQKIGRVKHISISVDTPAALPNTEAVQQIMLLFGFKKQLEDNMVDIEYGEPMSINVWEVQDAS